MFLDSVGRFAGFVSLNLTLMVNGVPWDVSFYLVASLSLLMAVIILVAVAREKSLSVREPESQLQQYLTDQAALVAEGEKPQRLTVLARGLWGCVLGLTTLYMPCTIYAVIAVFCHPSIQCLV